MPANIEVDIIQSFRFKATKMIKLLAYYCILTESLSLQNIINCEVFCLFVFKNIELKQKTVNTNLQST